jgi:glycosyltransferase involved in cell wall biosynthesis
VRILILHSRYRSGSASGENRVVESERELLRAAGHEVQVWDPTPAVGSTAARVRLGAGAVWSPSAARHVRRLVRESGVDVVHCHNLFPALSPAALRAAAAGGAAVVMTLHNYRLLCLPATFLRHGAPCESCLGRVPWRGVVHRCYRDSAIESLPLAAALTLHRRLGTFEQVDLFLAVSEYVRAKHLAGGMAAERIVVKPNVVAPIPVREGAGEYLLVLARLSREKGVDVVLAAHRPEHGSLVVAGDGPERARLEAQSAGRGITFLGDVPRERVPELLRRARALLVPSRSYEGAPLVVAEAFAAGVPVAASRIGGLAESVHHLRDGLLVTPGDVAGWGNAMTQLLDERLNAQLAAGAVGTWKERHAPEEALARLESAYSLALERRNHV